MSDLTHFDESGKARMVDVSEKAETRRTAVATGRLVMSEAAFEIVRQGTAQKGDVLGVARLAGIMAAKRTSDLIPLCHPLPLAKVSLSFEFDDTAHAIDASAEAKVTGQTGVEMEALTAVTVALLTIYDMVKAADKGMRIEGVFLVSKDGGRSGPYAAPELPRPATGTPKETEASAPPPERRARGPAPREIRMAPAGPPLQGTEQDLSRLRDFMASRGLRATDWAREAGVSSGFLFGFLQGRYRTIPTDYLEKLASAAGVRIEDLVGRRSP